MADKPLQMPPNTGPSCPQCERRPLTMDFFTGTFPNGMVASLIHCHDCGYVLPACFIGVDQNIAGPRIVTPGGRA